MSFQRFTSNAGHSYHTDGAQGNGYSEHAEAMKYNNEFIKQMKQVGYTVTNTTSEAKGQQAILSEQAHKANEVDRTGRLDVSFHFNSASASATGVEVLYYDQEVLASQVSQAIANALGIRNRGAKENKGLYFLANTNAPAILIEVAFISNAGDMKQATSKRVQAVAAIVKALTGKETPSAGFTGTWWRYARATHHIRTRPDWDSPVAFDIPNYYAVNMNYDKRENEFVEIEFQGQKGWFKDSLTEYWFEEKPTETYVVTAETVHFRDQQDWDSPVVQTKKKGDTVEVLREMDKPGWLQVILTEGVIGYIPDAPHYVKKV
ncbi:phagelysin [Listeria fleischmannii 1991]|uniref:N-acetylmuramoyl-L-alanine amidase LytC n=2 Tax=Listeria fleischmannii TaxID=1069827 RepID=A0A2X3HEB2_9LIST|nr:N-acetylmuramoyl-L-alanine amidase [Listeria fleischmannii]EMG27088.1 phage lysin [Listeria fleischmannii subsp. fleischmannii LU2006-1]KMT60949.1 phagelysin [Listeria fleischmannii 1991]SQC70611.1 N-acetylmuramoyl-L-alanine amidase LytC precursor [Listeria fleischmannii subsp. fleischmannii]